MSEAQDIHHSDEANDAKDNNALYADALVMTPPVLKLYGLKDANLVEEDAKSIFDYYSRSQDHAQLTLYELRLFLSDLQQAFGYPPFLPDECLQKALSEIQLDFDHPDSVSWSDFKSFFVYLVHSPLRHLHNLLAEQLSKWGCEFKYACLFSNLPAQLNREDFEVALTGIISSGIVKTFVSGSLDGLKSVAVVFFNSADSKSVALKASGCAFLGSQVKIEDYTTQPFPGFMSSSKKEPSIVAHALAQTVIIGQLIGEKTKELDTQYKVTDSLKSFDETHKISETTKSTFTSIAQGTVEIWKDFDEKTQVPTKTAELLENVKKSEVVQSGWSFLRGVVSNISATITELKAETVQVLEEQKAASPKNPAEQKDGNKEDNSISAAAVNAGSISDISPPPDEQGFQYPSTSS